MDCGRTGAFASSITGVENIEKIFRPLPVYSSDSACAISSGCSVGSRLAIDPATLTASGAWFAEITLCRETGAGPVRGTGAVAVAAGAPVATGVVAVGAGVGAGVELPPKRPTTL